MIVIINGRVVGPRAILEKHCVVIDGRTIKQVAPTSQVLWPEDATVIDAAGGFVAPGFIDLHLHGALGRDTMEASVEAFRAICDYHASGGTTSLLPTTATAPLDRITD